MKRWTKYFSSNREVENNLRSSTTSSVVEWELYDLANKFKRLQRIAVLQTYLFFKLFQAILIRCNLCILSDTTRKFDFQSISFNHRKQNLVNETRCTLFPPPPPCGTPSLIYLSFPHWWRKKWQSSISSSHCRNEEKKERKTRVRSEDDAFLDGRASTAANTPRLIRLGLEFSLHPSPRARIRLESCRRLIACQCLAIFGCRFSAGERMKRKTGGGIEEKYFSPSSRGKNRRRRRGRSKGTDFFSRSRSARCEFSTDFSLVRITYFRILNWVTIFVAIFLRQIPFISLFYKTSKLWITFETLY